MDFEQEEVPEKVTRKEEKEEEVQVVREPPPGLSPELKAVIDGKFVEFDRVKSKLDEVKEAIIEKEKKRDERKAKIELDLSTRTPDTVLKALHLVIRNADVIKYIEEAGDMVVYELDRGMGKNSIIFTKIDPSSFDKKMKELEDQIPGIINSKKDNVEKEKSLAKINEYILKVRKDRDYFIGSGGSIYLYVENEEKFHKLDYYSRSEKRQEKSLSLLRVYFGKNEIYEDSFHEFNTPELIMGHISKNLEMYGLRNIMRVQGQINDFGKVLDNIE